MWLVGGIYGYGYNVWVWLVGVVMRYIDILIIIINFTYSTCIRSFFGSSILTSLFIFKCFFGLVLSKDERGFPLTQYITNGRISRGGYTFTHFKHHHRVLRLIAYRMDVQHRHNSAVYVHAARS